MRRAELHGTLQQKADTLNPMSARQRAWRYDCGSRWFRQDDGPSEPRIGKAINVGGAHAKIMESPADQMIRYGNLRYSPRQLSHRLVTPRHEAGMHASDKGVTRLSEQARLRYGPHGFERFSTPTGELEITK
jgi:hypothetical protein